jgi:hypothetical protein
VEHQKKENAEIAAVAEWMPSIVQSDDRNQDYHEKIFDDPVLHVMVVKPTVGPVKEEQS